MKIPRVSRTVLTAALWLLFFLVNQILGVDVELVEPSDPEGDGFTLMEAANYVVPLLIAYFRVKAKETTTKLGIKTGDPLE